MEDLDHTLIVATKKARSISELCKTALGDSVQEMTGLAHYHKSCANCMHLTYIHRF